MDAPSIEQLQRTTDNKGQIVFMTMTCDSWPEPVRIVNATQNKTLAGVEHIALPFYFKLPERRQDSSARAQLAIDNVGREMAQYFEMVLPGDTVYCRISIHHNDANFRLLHDCYLPVSNISMDLQLVTADCGIAFVLSQKAVKLRMNQFLTPGIF